MKLTCKKSHCGCGRQVISFVLVLAILASLSLCAVADGIDETKEYENEVITDEFVQEYALRFMADSQKDASSLSVRDFYHLKNGNGVLTGYYITFDTEEGAAGYTLLSLASLDTPIVEFAFEGPGLLPQDVVCAVADTDVVDGSNMEEDSASDLIFTGAEQLYIPIDENLYYSVYDQETFSSEQVFAAGIQPCKAIGPGILDWNDASIKNSSVFKISSFGSGSDYWLSSDFHDEDTVCSPTTATNILWYWSKMRNKSSILAMVPGCGSGNFDKAEAIFWRVVNKMGTIGDSGTLTMNILSGYIGYFGEQAGMGKWNYKSIGTGSPFGTYQTALKDNCPIHLSLSTGTNRHGVMNMGYAESTTGTPYLMVMDCWND